MSEAPQNLRKLVRIEEYVFNVKGYEIYHRALIIILRLLDSSILFLLCFDFQAFQSLKSALVYTDNMWQNLALKKCRRGSSCEIDKLFE